MFFFVSSSTVHSHVKRFEKIPDKTHVNKLTFNQLYFILINKKYDYSSDNTDFSCGVRNCI